MKIALAQINTVVADIEGNKRRIEAATTAAKKAGADLVVFPELTVSGYDPKDLLAMPSFLSACERAVSDLAHAADWNRDIALVVGFPEPNKNRDGAPAFNSCALIHDGRVRRVARKCLLPSYDVLEEARFFEPSPSVAVASFKGLGLGLCICEDAWSSERFHSRRRHGRDPVSELVKAGADVILNLSASPFHRGKPAFRERMLSQLAAEHGAQVIMTNAVGGNDGVVFDGSSLAVAADGHVVIRCASFEEDLRIFDTQAADASSPIGPHPRNSIEGHATSDCSATSSGGKADGGLIVSEEDLADLRAALVLGIRDYCKKTGFTGALLGLSGGMDSALVATLACEALGPEHVTAVAMPSRHSSDGSLRDARLISDALGMELLEISIEKPFSAFLDVLSPHVWGREVFDATLFDDPASIDIAYENLQPRVRAAYLMALSNRTGRLVLVPGNKSEMAVGYSTLYGDMAGGLAPIGDVLKTTTYALARHLNDVSKRQIIPKEVFEKPPSAELRPQQRDEDSLPPYEVLDPIISAFVEEGLDLESIVQEGHDHATAKRVLEMIVKAEHKRRQAAPVIKVSPAPFGSGYRLPMALRFSPSME